MSNALNLKDSGLNKMRNLTPNFCFRLDDLKRRIVALRNDLRSFKLEQKGKLSFVSYLILSPKHIPDEDIQTAVDRGFEATTDFTLATNVDALILCVPTPLSLHREPPSVEIMQLMQDCGAEVSYSDPYVPVFPKMRRYNFAMESIEANSKNINSYDCIVVGTDHVDFDYKMI